MHGKQNNNPNLQPKLHNKHKTRNTLHHQYQQKVNNHAFLCRQHHLQIGNMFCQDCLCYNICVDCLDGHSGHRVKRYRNAELAIEQTKEVLLVEVEKTLSTLKSRQNDLKNKMEQINLLKQKMKTLSEQLIADLRSQVTQLQKKITNKLTLELQIYQKQLDIFYRQYNQVNNSLRLNLEHIIDGNINLSTFNKTHIIKDINIDTMPKFSIFKHSMQKIKKNMRLVRQSWRQFEGCLKLFNNQEDRAQLKYDKYDKFLKEKSCNQQHNLSLMKTLKILESNQQDLSILKAKLRM